MASRVRWATHVYRVSYRDYASYVSVCDMSMEVPKGSGTCIRKRPTLLCLDPSAPSITSENSGLCWVVHYHKASMSRSRPFGCAPCHATAQWTCPVHCAAPVSSANPEPKGNSLIMVKAIPPGAFSRPPPMSEVTFPSALERCLLWWPGHPYLFPK